MFEDEFAGQGGRYLLDPLTGKRTQLPDNDDVIPAELLVPAPDVVAKKKTAIPNPIIDPQGV
jgi:hypothetical protein